MDPTKAIRLAMMVAKGVSSVTDKPLFKKDGGGVDADLKTAKRLGMDTSSIPEIRKAGELSNFHNSLGAQVNERAMEHAQRAQEYHESGKLPMPVGTRFHTEHSRKNDMRPWTVVGHYVDSKDPEKYGYFAERGKPDDEDWSSGVLLASDPKADERFAQRGHPPIDRNFQALGSLSVAKADGGEVDVDNPLAMMGRPQRRMASKMAVGPQPLTIDAYHGTPHLFPPSADNPLGEFDSSKIGTGEGNEAYGHGHYLSETPGVAGEYKTNLSKIEMHDNSGKSIPIPENVHWVAKDLAAANGDYNKVRNDLKEHAKNYPWPAQVATKYIDELEAIGAKPKASGSLYTVHVPDEHVEKMLDWDKPLSEQHPHVQRVVKDIMQSKLWDEDTRKWMDQVGNPDIKGGKFYQFLANSDSFESRKPFFKPASEELARRGVFGIKYLDEQSRLKGKGTRNFVVFPGNEKHLKILKREAKGGAVYKAGGGNVKTEDVQKTIRRALMVARSAKGVGGSEFGKNNPVIESHAKENMPGVIVSPNPGMGGGPPITTEPNAVPTDEYRPAWNYTTPNIIGAAKPPPFQRPVQNAPRLSKVATKASTIFNSDGFNDLMGQVFDHHGIPKLNGKLQITPINGMYEGTLEPSFMIHHPEMTDDHAKVLAPLLGFGLQQDSVIHVSHSHGQEDSIPAALIRGTKKLTPVQIENISKIAVKHGMDGFSQTKDGTGVKFLHFGDPEDYDSFFEKAGNIADEAKLPYRGRIHTKSELINAKDYLSRAFGESARGSGSEGLQEPSPERSDLFRRTVDHVLAPYARAASSEGFRLSPERLAETYGLTDEDREHVRNALYPSSRSDQSVIPLMTGKEILDVRPTGEYGKPTVSDTLFALQNRAAEKGQIDPGDYSNTAMNRIAQNIAKEVHYHVNNSDKSAIGWYDAALKKAMAKYASIFPELSSDKNKELLFHSILGITSQGNDVYSNSINAARMYSLLRSENHDIPSAIKQLSGTFGNQTKAIEANFLKLHHLLENNGFDKMRQTFNKTMTVKEWRSLLQKDNSLYGPNGKPLSVDGSSDQKVTGWSVFGPKIGSFINNLHGNYSTLTADLWFTRTWNRLLGHGFDYSPEAEGKQFRDFRDVLRAEHYSNPNNMSYDARRLMPAASGKTEDGKIKTDKSGNPLPWEFGSDAKNLSRDDFEKIINDPEEMLKYASHLNELYKKGGYKDKSDLRRRAKNWIENRENPGAAPRGDLERNFQQNTVEKAQKLLKAKGLNISVADIQAALWFHEKELFNKLGVASEKAQPADYADAADKTLNAIQNKSLFASQRKDAVTKSDKKSSGGIVDRALHLVSHLSRR
jgi:hypothetical protein